MCQGSTIELIEINSNFPFTVDYHPIKTKLETNLTNNTVVVNENFNLTCEAQANPLAKYRFYREQESLFNTTVGKNSDHYTTAVSERKNQVDFSCTPFNYIGDGPTDTVTVKVHCKYNTQPVCTCVVFLLGKAK